MGPYCRYCDNRCFVYRVLPDGRGMLLATCGRGMAHDREQLGGLDHTNTTNPALATQP
jgi:hypothetical protein